MAAFEENGGRNLIFWYRDPQKALPCAEARRLTYFASKSAPITQEQIGVGASNLVGIIDVGVDACGILSRSVGQTNRK